MASVRRNKQESLETTEHGLAALAAMIVSRLVGADGSGSPAQKVDPSDAVSTELEGLIYEAPASTTDPDKPTSEDISS